MDITLPAVYKDIFPHGTPKPLEEYFKLVSKKFAFKIGKHLIKNNDRYFENSQLFLREWFSLKNQMHAENISSRLSNGYIVNVISSLDFYECVLKYCGEAETTDDLKMELDLFKAYMVINTNFNNKSDEFVKRVEVAPKDKQLIFLFLDQFRIHEYLNYNLRYSFGTTLIKAFEFYNFLEKNSEYLDVFYKEINHNNWKTYLLPLASQALKIVNDENIIGFDIDMMAEKAELMKTIIKNLVLSETVIPDEDYSYLKSNPIFHEGNERYLILHNKFFIEKIFIGSYFLISKNLQSKERNVFRELFTHHFSEKNLVFNILNKFFINNNEYQYLTGDEFRNKTHADGEPDAFVTNSKCCWIFESKDVFIEKKVKQTEDPRVLEEIFKKKFLNDGNKNKAINQLSKNIERILKRDFSEEVIPKNLEKIYPIIIVHRDEFNCPGFNRLLHTWHLTKMQELSDLKLSIDKVQPLVVIDIDTLILLSQKIQYSLFSLIDGYILEVMTLPVMRAGQEKLDPRAMYSFHHYIMKKFVGIDLFPAEEIQKYLPTLFEGNAAF